MGLPVIGDIQLFAESVQAPVIGITGTNGKSTVTTLVAQLLEASGHTVLAGGNLGRPALDLLKDDVPQFYVLELSSYQLEATHSLRLAAATVLNLTPDHMDRYVSVKDYAMAKARIFDHAEVGVLNADDSWVKSMGTAQMKKVFFSESDRGREFVLDKSTNAVRLLAHGKVVLTDSDIQLKGHHNHLNVLAALAILDSLNVNLDTIKTALKSFRGLPHRMETVDVVAGVTYINDSKGTNVGATIAAIKGSTAPVVLIAGGDGKGQDFSELMDACRSTVHHAILLGRDARAIGAVLENVCAVTYVENLEDAVRCSASVARHGDWVLMSPACASLDMFENYAHRGRVFHDAVARLSA